MSSPIGNGFDEPVASINVTPLVDVMLVLLVIFMITAPMMQQGVEVNLPKATTAPIVSSAESVVVSIDSAGKVFLGAGNVIDPDKLDEKVKAIMDERKEEDRKIYIQADQSVAYGVIMEVMSKIYAGGIRNIGLISDPLSHHQGTGK